MLDQNETQMVGVAAVGEVVVHLQQMEMADPEEGEEVAEEEVVWLQLMEMACSEVGEEVAEEVVAPEVCFLRCRKLEVVAEAEEVELKF